MTIQNLSSATLDEIVFEGRNKAYGAFQLRQLYADHLRKATLMTLALTLLVMGGVLVMQRLNPEVASPPPFVADKPITPTWVETTIKAAPAQPVSAPRRAAATTPTRVVADAKMPAKPEPTTIESVTDGPLTGPTTGPVGPATAGTEGGLLGVDTFGLDVTSKPAAPAKPYISVEVMPEFAGGQEALIKYLRKNLRFPAPALREGVSGKVFVSFTVAPTGDIIDVEVIKGLGFGTNEEAERVIRQMPPWQPGRQNGQNVAVRYTLPITFQYDK